MSNFNPSPEISIEEGVAFYEARSQQALTSLSQSGFAMPNPPNWKTPAGVIPYRGEIPADLTSLTDQELGTYMGLLSEWNGYVQFKLAEANSQLQTMKSELELVEAKLRIIYQKDGEGKKRSNPERDDHVRTDRRYVEVNGNLHYWETLYIYTRAIAASAENAFTAISRRITQRGQEIDRTNRTGNTTGHVNLPQGALFGPRPHPRGNP